MSLQSDFENQLNGYTEKRKTEFSKVTKQYGFSNADETVRLNTSLSQHESISRVNHNHPIDFKNRFSFCSILPDNSINVGTLPLLGGVPLHVHSLWLAFIVVSCLGALQISYLFALYSFILGGPVLFLTVLVHELGHAAMAVKLGGQVDRILLWPLGGLAYISFFGETSPKSDALVAIGGPLTHFPQAAFWCGVMAVSNDGVVGLSWPLYSVADLWVCVCAGALAIQLALFLFNLIPAYPLDGGRLFGALLQHWGVDRNKSFQYSAALGFVIGSVLLMNALGSIMAGSFSYFEGWNLLFLSLFILWNCRQLWLLGSSGRASLHPGFDSLPGSGGFDDAAAPFSLRSSARQSGYTTVR